MPGYISGSDVKYCLLLRHFDGAILVLHNPLATVDKVALTEGELHEVCNLLQAVLVEAKSACNKQVIHVCA
jgi:hypothetical protein